MSDFREVYEQDHDSVRTYKVSVAYILHCYRDFLRHHIKNEILVETMDDVTNLIDELKDKIEIIEKHKE